jgi:hypothetical protein
MLNAEHLSLSNDALRMIFDSSDNPGEMKASQNKTEPLL